MYQAITTKYLGPTNVRGSRVKATCQAGSLTLGWDDRWNSTENHTYAAMQLAHRLDWRGRWSIGWDKDDHGVFVPEGETFFTHDYEPHVKGRAV